MNPLAIVLDTKSAPQIEMEAQRAARTALSALSDFTQLALRAPSKEAVLAIHRYSDEVAREAVKASLFVLVQAPFAGREEQSHENE